MTSLPKVSLEDTLYLIQLARETALSSGKEEQANRLAPVAEEMRKVVTSTRQSTTSAPVSTGILGQTDFQVMLDATQVNQSPSTTSTTSAVQPVSATSAIDRTRMVGAMSSSGMSELDIAPQLGMTRDEVKLVLNIQNRGKRVGEMYQ